MLHVNSAYEKNRRRLNFVIGINNIITSLDTNQQFIAHKLYLTVTSWNKYDYWSFVNATPHMIAYLSPHTSSLLPSHSDPSSIR